MFSAQFRPSFNTTSVGGPSNPTSFAFAIASVAVATYSCMGLVPRAFVTGFWRNLFVMSGSSLSHPSFANVPFISQ